MGKKKGDKEKKVKGAEKTRMKTEKNLEKKCKKLMKETGEKDIELMVAECQAAASKRQQVTEEKCAAPSLRCNMSLTAHPSKDLLIMFGGEFYNGRKTEIYDDLFFYNIKNNEWSQVKCPNSPAPRCSHQAVALSQRGGELWLFGGEFPSPTQSQYHHFKDLWVLQLTDLQWRKVSAPGGPSARSGHRMVSLKKLLVVFAGYHDNFSGVYSYYNDVHVFNTDTFLWMKVEITGQAPSPRSGCVMATTEDQSQIVVYGGYSKEKIKKDQDKGNIHTDMFMLQLKSKSSADDVGDMVRLRWSIVKQTGCRPSPRCSASLVVTGGNRAFYFGGVFDEEDDESIRGKFYNDMYSLDIDKGRWNQLTLRGQQQTESGTGSGKKRRRAKEQPAAAGAADDDNVMHGDDDDDDDDDVTTEIDDVVEKLQVNEPSASGSITTNNAKVTTSEDGVFTVRIGGASAGPTGAQAACNATTGSSLAGEFVPCGRMNALLCVKKGLLYMYGGIYESDDDKQITLSDFYSLDLHRLQRFHTIIPPDLANMDWQESDDDDDDDDDGDDDDDDDDDVDMDSDDDDDDDS